MNKSNFLDKLFHRCDRIIKIMALNNQVIQSAKLPLGKKILQTSEL